MPTIQPGVLNLDMYAGADFELPFTVYQNNVAVDLTGWDIRMKARIDYTASTAVVDLSVAGGDVTIATTNVTIFMPGDDTATVGSALGHAKTMLVYDIELEDPAGAITRILMGSLTVWPEATR